MCFMLGKANKCGVFERWTLNMRGKVFCGVSDGNGAQGRVLRIWQRP